MGDIVTMFFNFKDGIVSWYVNDVFAGKQELLSIMKHTHLYPFVQLEDYGETVRIVQ